LYLATSLALAPIGQALGQVYYVSPTGSDSNSGTSASSPWQTLAKVDSTTFSPGSQVLFQDGSNWYGQQLAPISSGTVSQPITYGSYGSGANPTFWGSVNVPSSSFEPVYDEPDTYFYPTTTTVNAFLVNHQFTHNASLVSGQSTDAGNISYVESTTNTNYYDPNSSAEANGAKLGAGIYINIGGPLSSGATYGAAILDSVINDYGQSNLVFKNLNVEESAAYNAGYGINIQNTSNVQVLNSTVIASGKHAIAAIDSTGFVGENLNASYMMPDQGYGGASAYVAFSDQNVSGTTSKWINDTFSNANGEYPAFITHSGATTSDPTPIGSALVQNMVTDSYPAIDIQTAGNETVNITGGHATNGAVILEGNNTTVNGMLVTGANGAIEVNAGTTGNVIENSIVDGATPNWTAGHDGAIIDAGTGTVIRFNTIVMGQGDTSFGAAIALENNSTGSQIYGNIIDTPYAAFYQHSSGTPTMNAFDNLFGGTSTPEVIFLNFSSPDTPVADYPSSISSNELYGNPNFVNVAGGNVAIEPNSVAAYVFNPTSNEYVMYDYYNNVRPASMTSLGAIEVAGPSLTWTDASKNGVWDATSNNWNNGSATTVYANESAVFFNDSNGGNYNVTLNSTVSPGLVLVNNSSGNYTISGTGSIGGIAAISKSGSASLTLSTVNSYSGGTIVTAGTLVAAVHGALGSGAITVAGGELKLAANTGTTQATTLSVSGNGTLDISNNAIIVNYGNETDPIGSIASFIASGYANGAWNGTGIMSSAAQSNSASYGIGYADAADPGNPAGLSAGTIEIMYTLLGDANLDGKVNGIDFSLMAANFNDTVTNGWDEGDFNYDGKVNGSDFILLADNFNQFASQSSVSSVDAAALDAFAVANGISLENVPEPASIAMIGLAGLGMLRRRRRAPDCQ
jgi:autotransporter-associated beta strand protein